jgi:hypothetical protein
VDDVHGRPATGANVSLAAEHGPLRAVTDAWGRYAFEVPSGTWLGLLVVRHGAAVASRGVPRPDNNIVVPTITLTGRFDVGGPAQLAVEVMASGKPVFATLTFEGHVLESRDGSFLIDMDVHKVKIHVESPGMQPQDFEATPAVGGVAMKRIELRP